MFERQRGQLDEWLLLNHCVKNNECQLTDDLGEKTIRRYTYFVQAFGVEAIPAGLTRFVGKVSVHSADKPKKRPLNIPDEEWSKSTHTSNR